MSSETKWLPGSQAPKDGTRILAAWDGWERRSVVFFNEEQMRWASDDGRGSNYPVPDHFQYIDPLPKPKTAREDVKALFERFIYAGGTIWDLRKDVDQALAAHEAKQGEDR